MSGGNTTSRCPYNHVRVSYTRELVRDGQYTSPAENQSEQYANLAIAFDEFCITYGDSLISELDALYDAGIDRYTYMVRMRAKLYESIMESSRFPLVLNSGISTFFLIINGVLTNSQNVTEEQLKISIIQWAGSLKRETLPPSNDPNITESYKYTVGLILQNPGIFMKNTNEKRDGLPCPIVFTKYGKGFLEKIIRLLYKYFPVS